MDREHIDNAVHLLIEARRAGKQIDGLPDICRPRTPEEGYAIQDAFAAAWGEPAVGWKIGCTTQEQQTFLGVDEPFTGRIFRSVLRDSPAVVPADTLHLRGIETEFAFRMAADLPPRAEAYDEAEVAGSVAAVIPAIELVDSRFTEWHSRGAAQTIADNAANGGLILGAPVADWRDVDLARHKAAIAFDGEKIDEGVGGLALGGPLTALAWCANHLSKRGLTLKAGEVVTTGTVAGYHPAPPGTRAIADFGILGSVEVTLVG